MSSGMSSPGLSSLLVRDGVVSVKRMERAFQHQVIDGGTLDTILLEQELVSEEQLIEYLAQASGLPAATWDDCEVIDEEALRRLPHDVAVEFDVAPLDFDEGELAVLVKDPVDLDKLGVLANRLGVTLVPLIAPEYRWHLVFTRDYDLPPEDRFVALATAAGAPLDVEPRHRAAQDSGDEPALVHGRAPVYDDDVPAPAGDDEAGDGDQGDDDQGDDDQGDGDQGDDDRGDDDGRAATAPAEPPADETGDDGDDEAHDRAATAPVEPPDEEARAATAPVEPPDDGDDGEDEPGARAETAPLDSGSDDAWGDDEPAEAAATSTLPEHVEAPEPARVWASQPSVIIEYMPEVDAAAAAAADAVPTPPPDDEALAANHATTQELPAWRGAAADAARASRQTRPGLAVAPEPTDAPARPAAPVPPSGPHESAAASDGVPHRPLASELPTAHSATRVSFLDEDERPLGRTTALHLIEAADDRDRVFYALLRALRSRTRWAGVLVVQGGAAVGRVALADVGIDTSGITNITIPLDRPSPFHAVVMGRHPYVGHVTSGDPAIDDMVVRMGGTVPSAALLLPIVLRDRCVALAVAHRGALPLTLADVSDFLPLAPVAAQALGRILLSRKRDGSSPPPPNSDPLTPRSPRAATFVPAVQRGGTVSGVVTATRSAAESITSTAPVIHAPALRSLAAVLADLESDDPALIETAVVEASLRSDELLPLIPARFPGPLRVDRYAAGGRTLLPSQYGPMLDLVVRIGPRATDLLIELLADTDRDVRFYAAVCLGGIRPRAAVQPLAERIFDPDFGVRNAAIEVLHTFSPRDIDFAMSGVRPALHSEDVERVSAVAHAVSTLVDVGALADLVEVVGRDARRAEVARRALVALTRHDLGTSARRWRSWYDEHRSRHRIEWLIDALGHRDQPLREAALEDLRRVTGEDFGSGVDDSRKEREALSERWRAWWGKTGRRRFVA